MSWWQVVLVALLTQVALVAVGVVLLFAWQAFDRI